MELILMYAMGVFMGYILCKILLRPKSVGCIRIDNSDGEGPYMFLELDESVDNLSKRHYAYVEIKKENLIPHE